MIEIGVIEPQFGNYLDEIDPNNMLRELQEIVGGYIQPIYLGNGEVMIVNEEGLMIGLPHNQVASRIAGQRIVGVAVVMDEKDFD